MRVVGTVVEEESGKPLAGLQVRAFDKDLFFDEKIGSAITDDAGRFRIHCSSKIHRRILSISTTCYGAVSQLSRGNLLSVDFSLFGFDESPKLYIRVFDAGRTTLLYSTGKEIRKGFVEERFDIRISKHRLT